MSQDVRAIGGTDHFLPHKFINGSTAHGTPSRNQLVNDVDRP